MGKIQNKIKEIELDIQSNQEALQENMSLLTQKIHEPKFIGFAIVAGFASGYLLGSQSNRIAIKETLAQAPSALHKIFEHVKIILPLLSL
jgi:hypothetical protein